MKKVTIALAIATTGFFTTATQAQSLKEKMAAKMAKGNSKGGGGFEELNAETDPMGVTGQYFGLSDKKACGFKFMKEVDGKIVNQLYYYEKKMTPEPVLKMSMKESYYSKNKVKLFYIWTSTSAGSYIETIELEPGVFAQTTQSSQSVQDGPATLDAKRTVKDVYAKDQAKFDVYDLETAQVKVDMIIASLNTEKLEKEKEKWMAFDVYKNNVDKIVFSDQWYNLQKQGYPNKIGVDGKGFKTELDMAGNMVYMAFFSYPPAAKYPGQQINVEYEMDGKKANREECRKRSAAWSNMVKIIETKDFNYNQSSTRSIREYNTYHSQYIQDYAAIQVLFDNKDKFKKDGVYTMTIKMYAHRDGEDGDLLSEGVVKLKYTDAAKKAFEGDPAKPELKGVWGHFEAFLDE